MKRCCVEGEGGTCEVRVRSEMSSVAEFETKILCEQ